MPNSLICLDASIVVQVLINPLNNPVQQQWQQWHREGQRFVAPSLQRYEVTNVLYRYQYTGQLSGDTIEQAMRKFFTLPIDHADERSDHQRAMEIARQFNRPAAYDAHYLALAERLDIDFWTVDRRLANSVRHALPWVHLVGDDTSQSS
jgi:predicted nucleic acid-binding protein